MTNDRRNNDKALISVLKKKEEQSRQTKPSFGFADRIMQQVKISAHRKQIRNKRRTLAGIITMTVAASILLLVMLNHEHHDGDVITKPDMVLNTQNKNLPKTEHTENPTAPSIQKPHESTQQEKIVRTTKSDGPKLSSIRKSYKKETCMLPNRQSANQTMLRATVPNPSITAGDSESQKESPQQNVTIAKNHNADFHTPQKLVVDRVPEVCIECDFQEMEAEMTAMINELETPSEP